MEWPRADWVETCARLETGQRRGSPLSPSASHLSFGSTRSTIAFTGAPASGATFSGQIFGDTLDIGTPSDATVTAAKLTSIQGAYRNVQTLTGGLSIAASENASIVGPVTVSSGQTINVASGGTLVIL